jgi:hypothetical protein
MNTHIRIWNGTVEVNSEVADVTEAKRAAILYNEVALEVSKYKGDIVESSNQREA